MKMKVKLGDVCNFYAGTGFPVAYQGKDSGELPFYKVGDIANNVSVGKTYLELCNNYISREDARVIKGVIVPKGTVVFAKIGEALKLNRRAITSCDCLIDNNAMGIAPISSFLKEKYFFYYMKHLKMQELAESTTVPSVRKSKLEAVIIEVPTIQEQEKIENQLDKISDIIIMRKQQLQQLDDLVKARFVEMFGDPTDIRLSRVPLIEYVENTKYGTSQPPQFDENGCFKFIRATNIKSGHINEKDMLFISKEESEKIGKCKLNGGEIIIVRSGANTGDTCVITDEYKGQYAGYDIIVTLKTDKLNPVFLNELINIPRYMKTVVKPLTARSAQPHLNTQQVQSLPILVVDIDKQKEFAVFVEQIDKSKVAVQKALDEAQILFDSLMQEYFG